MRVEVSRAVVAGVFEQLDDEEVGLDGLGPEPQILIVATELLVVEIDVKELPRFERLGDGMVEVQPRHVLVRDLRVHADHLGVLAASG